MNTWIIPIVFVFLASALAWVIIGSKGLWYLKLVMMIATILLAIQIWSTAESYLGFAKPTTMDKMKGVKASILWTYVEEGNFIYLWMVVGKDAPKVYRFPYTKPLHKSTVAAMDQILDDKGDPVQVLLGEEPKKEATSSQYGGVHGGNGDGGGTTDAIGEFYILPPALVSPKTQH